MYIYTHRHTYVYVYTHTHREIYMYIHTTRARCNVGSDRTPFYFTSARERIAASKFFRSIHSLLKFLAKSDPFLFDISERADRSLQSIRWSTTFDYTLAHFGHVRLSGKPLGQVEQHMKITQLLVHGLLFVACQNVFHFKRILVYSGTIFNIEFSLALAKEGRLVRLDGYCVDEKIVVDLLNGLSLNEHVLRSARITFVGVARFGEHALGVHVSALIADLIGLKHDRAGGLVACNDSRYERAREVKPVFLLGLCVL
mmetsp:Transcript_47045/g.69029  ORF Transcript_47045/g.69029 Transcript_47045/m.69029 type:complete len:256 (-) Transcript_47045:738-1505(-)